MQSKMEKDYEKGLFPKCMHEGNTLLVLSYMNYMLSLNLKGFLKSICRPQYHFTLSNWPKIERLTNVGKDMNDKEFLHIVHRSM